MRTIRTASLTILAAAALSGCSAAEVLSGQASAEEVCTDVASVVQAVQGGTLPGAQDLVEIEARLRLGVDDEAVQAAGSAFRDEARTAAEAIGTGGPAALPEVGPGLLEAGLQMGPACDAVGVPIA